MSEKENKVTLLSPHDSMTAEQALKYVLQEEPDSVLIISLKGDTMKTRCSKLTREEVYYMLGCAQKQSTDTMF